MHNLRRKKLMDRLIGMGRSDFSKSEDEREILSMTDLGILGSYIHDKEEWERLAEDDQKYPLEAVVCIDCKVDVEDPQKHSHKDVIGNKDVAGIDGGQTHSSGAREISCSSISSHRLASDFCVVCLAFRLGFLNSGNLKRKCDADRHNKEQHTLNGNIHIDKDVATSEDQLYEQLIALSRDLPAFPEKPHASICQMQMDAANMIPLDYYTDSVRPPEAIPTADGTLHTPVFYAGERNRNLLAHQCACLEIDPREQLGNANDEETWPKKAVCAAAVHTAECISINKQREERVARTYSFGGPGEEGPRGAWGSVPDGLFDDVGWQAIGISHGSEHGRLVLSELGKHYVHELTKPPHSRDVPPLVDALIQQVDSKADWRRLGVRIALYDDLREPRITQPTGVDHVIARKDFYRRDNIIRSGLSGFGAAFVDFTVIEEAFGTVDKIVSLGSEKWRMDQCIVIGLPIYDSRQTAGLEAWILSHLPFPLLEVAETFDLQKLTDWEDRDKCYATYLRNSGLISIPESFTNIMFVVSTPSAMHVDLGGALFPVYSIMRTPPEDFVYIHDFDNNVEVILKSAMSCETTLRSSFSTFATTYFNTGFNWYEIDQIVCGMTTRWPRRVEGSFKEKRSRCLVETLYRDEISVFMDSYDLENCSSGQDGPLPQRYLWAADLVNSWDQVVSSRAKAEMYPCLQIGGWNLAAELLLSSGIALYVTENVEDEALVKARAKNSGHERLKRGGIQRYIMEEWKSRIGLQEYLVRGFRDYASTIEAMTVGPVPNSQLCANALLVRIIGQHLAWCWNLAFHCRDRDYTNTGIRTSSSWWGSNVSRKWEKTDVGEITEGWFKMYRDIMYWSGDIYRKWWVLVKKAPEIEKALQVLRQHLMKVNWLIIWGHMVFHRSWDQLQEYSWGTYEKSERVYFRLSSNCTKNLYCKAGWHDKVSDWTNVTWGWGMPTYYMYRDQKLIITLHSPLVEALASPVITRGFWLSCGPEALTDSSDELPSVILPEKLQFASSGCNENSQF